MMSGACGDRSWPLGGDLREQCSSWSWGETVIPFETDCDFHEDLEGSGHLVTRFVFFGLSPAANASGIAPNVITSPVERRKYMLLAAEAFLVFWKFLRRRF
jgi:hypothetical protein